MVESFAANQVLMLNSNENFSRSSTKDEDSAFKSKARTARNPLNLDEMKHLANPLGENSFPSTLGQAPGKRFYSEDEVLLLIKNLVKEFGSIMDKMSQNQSSFPPGNGGFSNLNSILILSLMTNDQSKTAVPQSVINGQMESLNSNLFNSLSDVSKLPLFPSSRSLPFLPKSNDLSSLLNSQAQSKNEEKISSENLLKIPKIKSCPKTTHPSLDSFLQERNLGGLPQGFSTPQKSDSPTLKPNSKPSVPRFGLGEGVVKKYDSLQAEGKEELFSNPTLESKQDPN